ncbi:hypothetical protein D3C77_505920 [compost metagenome]
MPQHTSRSQRDIRIRLTELGAVSRGKHFRIVSNQARLSKNHTRFIRELFNTISAASNSIAVTLEIAERLQLHPNRKFVLGNTTLPASFDHAQRFSWLTQQKMRIS